jgi:hypothetical protein
MSKAKYVAFDANHCEFKEFMRLKDAEAWLLEVAYENDHGVCDLVAAGESYIARITHRTAITRKLTLEAVE